MLRPDLVPFDFLPVARGIGITGSAHIDSLDGDAVLTIRIEAERTARDVAVPTLRWDATIRRNRRVVWVMEPSSAPGPLGLIEQARVEADFACRPSAALSAAADLEAFRASLHSLTLDPPVIPSLQVAGLVEDLNASRFWLVLVRERLRIAEWHRADADLEVAVATTQRLDPLLDNSSASDLDVLSAMACDPTSTAGSAIAVARRSDLALRAAALHRRMDANSLVTLRDDADNVATKQYVGMIQTQYLASFDPLDG